MHATTTCLVVGETTGGPCMHAACIARRAHAHVSSRRAFLNAYMCEESFPIRRAGAGTGTSERSRAPGPARPITSRFQCRSSFIHLPTYHDAWHHSSTACPALPYPRPHGNFDDALVESITEHAVRAGPVCRGVTSTSSRPLGSSLRPALLGNFLSTITIGAGACGYTNTQTADEFDTSTWSLASFNYSSRNYCFC